MAFFEEILPQQFPLPKPIIRYLCKNANVEILKKFQKTCKYFYSKLNFTIIDHLRVNYCYGDKIIMENYDLRIRDHQIKFFQNKFYLSKCLRIHGRFSAEILYPKIYKCTISELITGYITINDFALLTKLGKLEILHIEGGIFYPDNKSAPLEVVLSYIPNVYHFSYKECTITSNTMTKLFLLKRNVKFSRLSLTDVTDLLDPHLFNDYIKKMFDFENPRLRIREIELMGNGNVLKQIYQLVKPWRERSRYWDIGGDDGYMILQ